MEEVTPSDAFFVIAFLSSLSSYMELMLTARRFAIYVLHRPCLHPNLSSYITLFSKVMSTKRWQGRLELGTLKAKTVRRVITSP